MLKPRFAGRLWMTKSLPFFLEFAHPDVSKGVGARSSSPSGSASHAAQTVAFGDGENDLELVEWAGYGVAVENAAPRMMERADWVCPPAAEEGVARCSRRF